MSYESTPFRHAGGNAATFVLSPLGGKAIATCIGYSTNRAYLQDLLPNANNRRIHFAPSVIGAKAVWSDDERNFMLYTSDKLAVYQYDQHSEDLQPTWTLQQTIDDAKFLDGSQIQVVTNSCIMYRILSVIDGKYVDRRTME